MYTNVIRSLVLLVLSGFSVHAYAFGIGLYTTTINSGTAEWDGTDYCYSYSYSCSTYVYESDIDQKEFGFMLDTTIAEDRLFNYRLQLALVNSSYDNLDLDGIAVTNTFGFGVVRTSVIRVWVGPQLAFKVLEGKGNSDAVLVGLELGPAVGINIHIASSMSIVAELGYRFGSSYIESTDNNYEYDVDENRVFANVGLLFRFGDRY